MSDIPKTMDSIVYYHKQVLLLLRSSLFCTTPRATPPPYHPYHPPQSKKFNITPTNPLHILHHYCNRREIASTYPIIPNDDASQASGPIKYPRSGIACCVEGPSCVRVLGYNCVFLRVLLNGLVVCESALSIHILALPILELATAPTSSR